MDFADIHALQEGVINAVGALPLTPEQASSLRSAIMLLSEGDGVGQFAMPRHFSEQRNATGEPQEHEDRNAFAGMYS